MNARKSWTHRQTYRGLETGEYHSSIPFLSVRTGGPGCGVDGM